MSNNINDEFIEEIKKNDILARYSIRGFLLKIIPTIIFVSYMLTLWNAIPAKGLKVAHFFKLAPLSFPPILIILALILIVSLNKVFLKNKTPILVVLGLLGAVIGYFYFQMPNYMVNKQYIDIIMLSLSGLMILQPIYFVLFAKTGFVAANDRKIEINEGVFGRIKDPTDMVNIEDCDQHTPFSYRLLGLSQLKIKLKKGNEVISLMFLNKEDCENLYNYIHAKAFNSSVEYWTTRDRLKNQARLNDKKYIEDIEQESENDGEEIEPNE